jgi:simple sugar transport system permease protein
MNAAPAISAPTRSSRFERRQARWWSSLVWPVAGLGLLLLFNLVFTAGFFHVEVRDGRLYGVLIDVLNHGSKVMLLALGMALVIATGGVDLSVGAVMAIAGAVAAQLINRAGVPFPVVIAVSLAASLVAGCWNGLLVGAFKVQPIVATLILMVAGRGIAQLITDGQIITFTDQRLTYVGNGGFLGFPFPVLLSSLMLAITGLLTRKTAVGLFIESVGDNQTASTYSGVHAGTVKFLVYAFSGLCAGLAGLVAASNIKCADSNHAGLFLELDAILAVVVGGTSLTGGRFFLAGAIVGALFIQTLTTTMYMRNVSADIAPVPKALAILTVCLLQSQVLRAKAAGVFKRKPA